MHSIGANLCCGSWSRCWPHTKYVLNFHFRNRVSDGETFAWRNFDHDRIITYHIKDYTRGSRAETKVMKTNNMINEKDFLKQNPRWLRTMFPWNWDWRVNLREGLSWVRGVSCLFPFRRRNTCSVWDARTTCTPKCTVHSTGFCMDILFSVKKCSELKFPIFQGRIE